MTDLITRLKNCPRRPLRHRTGNRQRRHGHRLSGSGSEARPEGRSQSPQPRSVPSFLRTSSVTSGGTASMSPPGVRASPGSSPGRRGGPPTRHPRKAGPPRRGTPWSDPSQGRRWPTPPGRCSSPGREPVPGAGPPVRGRFGDRNEARPGPHGEARTRPSPQFPALGPAGVHGVMEILLGDAAQELGQGVGWAGYRGDDEAFPLQVELHFGPRARRRSGGRRPPGSSRPGSFPISVSGDAYSSSDVYTLMIRLRRGVCNHSVRARM